MKNIVVLTSSAQSLASVEIISKDLQEIYLRFKTQDVSVEICDINNRTFYEKDLNAYRDCIFACIHPGVIRSDAFTKVAREMKEGDKLLIHVFGDFARQAPFFYEAQKHLKGKQVAFLPPTRTYGDLIAKLISNKKSIMPTSFPVDLKGWQPKDDVSDFNQKYSISDEIIFVYGGRISRQKNVEQLLEWFTSLNSTIKRKLFIVGKFDDFEVASIGNNLKLGELYQRLIPYESNEVIFIDHLPHEELYQFYNIADYFVSFSTYHDEDFGRAPIEAILCGTRCLLSDWGGFRDLIQDFPETVTGITVSLNQNGLELNTPSDFNPAKKKHSDDARALEDKHSKETCFKSLSLIIQNKLPEYEGGTGLLESLATRSRSFFYNKNGELLTESYRLLYKNFGTNI